MADGGFVALFHRGFAAQFDAAFIVDADALDPDHVAHLDHVLGAVHAEVGEFADVAEAVLAGQDFDEAAEFLDGNDGALIGLADFDLLGHARG